ncbi:MAG: hypothetical protein Q8K68_13585 [Nitrospirota bacterium]|nr:hypothetical protein [Nitrospirota bacterium]
MFCPICSCRLMPVGSTMVESMDTPDGAVTTVENTYQCRNVECESFTEDYIWTFNGESFIMHHIERHLEAA